MLLATVVEQSRLRAEGGYRIGDGWLIPDVSVLWPGQTVVGDYLAGSPMVAIGVHSPRIPHLSCMRRLGRTWQAERRKCGWRIRVAE